MLKKWIMFFVLCLTVSLSAKTEFLPLETKMLPQLVTEADLIPAKSALNTKRHVIIFVHGYSATIKESQIIWENIKRFGPMQSYTPVFVNVYDLKLDGQHVQRFKEATPEQMRQKVLTVYNEVLKQGVPPENVVMFGISFGGALVLDLTLENQLQPKTRVIVHDPYIFDQSFLNRTLGWWVSAKWVGSPIRSLLSHVQEKSGNPKNKTMEQRQYWFDYFYVPAILDVLAFSSKVSDKICGIPKGKTHFHNSVLCVLSDGDTYGDSRLTVKKVMSGADVVMVPSPVHVTMQSQFHTHKEAAVRLSEFVGVYLTH